MYLCISGVYVELIRGRGGFMEWKGTNFFMTSRGMKKKYFIKRGIKWLPLISLARLVMAAN